MGTRKHLDIISAAIAFLLAVMTCIAVADSRTIRIDYDAKELPVYFVTKSGATQEEAQTLAEMLDVNTRILDEKEFVKESGLVTFIDPNRFQYVPVKQLGAGKLDEDGNETTLEAFDFEALEKIRAIDGQKIRARFMETLKKAGLHPSEAEEHVGHSIFEAVDLEGKTIAKAKLDTKISFTPLLDGIPLVGPGANISATFDGERNVTQLCYANRRLKQGDSLPILSQAEAEDQFAELVYLRMPNSQIEDLKVDAELVYYAPPLDLDSVRVIMPFYECNATAIIAKEEVTLLSEMIPAVKDIKYVPNIYLSASAKGANVRGHVDIKGGTPPYRIDWSSSSTYISESARSIEYEIRSRASIEEEIVMVTVTDANGVSVSDTMSLDLCLPVQTVSTIIWYWWRSFGTENPVTNQFGNLEQGFVDEMLADGVTQRFGWTGMNAWEQDFKAPNDSNWVDNVDITLYVGHGNGDGFTFEDNGHDDDKLDYNDATGDWGDKNLEWLALYSCQVLEQSWSGMNIFQRWKQEFDGLHLLLGFRTDAQVRPMFTGAFAHNMLNECLTVREAWFHAINSDQPNDRIGVVMGPWRAGDFVTNYNDHFWNKGSVGPDIPDGNIGGFWAVTGP